jgi:hypothetical protein
VAFTWIQHVWKLDKCAIPKLIRVVAALRRVLGSTSDEDATIVGLNRAESDRNVEVDAQQFARLFVLIHVVECYHALVELKEVDSVGLP